MNSGNLSLAAGHASGVGVSPRLYELAARLGLPLVGEVDPRFHRDHAQLVYQSPDGLVLQATGKGAPGPVMSEFVRGKADHRRRQGGGRGQLIARAVGIGKRRAPLTVLDATAGLGQDAFVLATLGARVQLLERSPLAAALLADGLERLAAEAELADLGARLSLLEVDARQWLARNSGAVADVIHLDPMFPHRRKSARVKKEMTAFQALVGDDGDAEELLQLALERARFRVAVKRPRQASSLAGPVPDLVLEGKSIRYDIYTRAAIT